MFRCTRRARETLARLEMTGPLGDPDAHKQQAVPEALSTREQLEEQLAEQIPELNSGPYCSW